MLDAGQGPAIQTNHVYSNFMTRENLRMRIVTFFYSKDFEQKKLSWKKKKKRKKDLNRRLIYGIG